MQHHNKTLPNPKVSVALATYNGEQFLLEQLASLEAQSKPPCEVVIVDDGSTDKTPVLARSFAEDTDINVLYFENEVRLGYAKNFERAIDLCSGDYIFLCDQDDVWEAHKVERTLEVFETNPSKLVVINDARLVNADLEDTGLSKLGQIKNSGQSVSQFVTGCCTAIRSDFKELLLPIPDEVFVHDTWLHALACTLDARVVLDETLQLYRRHGKNASGANHSRLTTLRPRMVAEEMLRESSLVFARRQMSKIKQMKFRLSEVRARTEYPAILPSALKDLEVAEQAVMARIALLQQPRLRRIGPATLLAISGGYKAFSGWRSFVKDILIA